MGSSFIISENVRKYMFATLCSNPIANMYFLTFSLMIKDDPMLLSAMKTAGITVDMSNIDYVGVLNNLVPVTLGNIVGGCLFVGLVYWLAYLRNNRKEN